MTLRLYDIAPERGDHSGVAPNTTCLSARFEGGSLHECNELEGAEVFRAHLVEEPRSEELCKCSASEALSEARWYEECDEGTEEMVRF
jgi:hypothetical protein